MPAWSRACAIVLLLLAALPAAPAAAQIRRCVTAEGGHVYTDRKCEELGASERGLRPQATMAQGGGRVIRRDCSRNLRDLVGELTAAIEHRDVNRLAGIYHWPGMSARGAHAVMGRLDTVVNRPLIDIAPLHPPPAPEPVQYAGERLAWQTLPRNALAQNPAPAAAATGSGPASGEDVLPAAVHAAARRRQDGQRPPTALVVDQAASNRISSLQTVFSLHRHLGCWWVSL